jgi:hypothetical protein
MRGYEPLNIGLSVDSLTHLKLWIHRRNTDEVLSELDNEIPVFLDALDDLLSC